MELLSNKIKRLRSDGDGEYESNPFNTFCEKHGIIHETTPFYSPKSNGVTERKNIILKEMMHSMLVSLGVRMTIFTRARLTCPASFGTGMGIG